MRIKNWVLPVTVFVVFWGVIGIGIATDFWQVKQTAGEVFSAEDLKGWMTLEEISLYTKVSTDELMKALVIPDNTAHNKKLKDIAAEKGVETDKLKESLSRYFSGSKGGEPAASYKK